MSARRRQEAIEKFSVPIQASEVPIEKRASRSSRAPRSSKASSRHAEVDPDSSDDEYMPVDEVNDNDQAYESLVSAEDNPRVMLISLKAVSFALLWVLCSLLKDICNRARLA